MKDAEKIARDIELCELGIALTKGTMKARFVKHRKACMDRIREQNRIDGLDSLSPDDIARELEEDLTWNG